MRGTDAEHISAADRRKEPMPNRFRLQIRGKNRCRTDIGCRSEERTYAKQISAANNWCQTDANWRKEPTPNSCKREEEPMPNDCKKEEGPMPNRFRLQIGGRKMQNLITNTDFRGYRGSKGSTEVRRCIRGSKGSLDAKHLKVQRDPKKNWEQMHNTRIPKKKKLVSTEEMRKPWRLEREGQKLLMLLMLLMLCGLKEREVRLPSTEEMLLLIADCCYWIRERREIADS
jgi:hypothetical protein